MTLREEQWRSQSSLPLPPALQSWWGRRRVDWRCRQGSQGYLSSGPKYWFQCSKLLKAGMLFCPAELCISKVKEKIDQLCPWPLHRENHFSACQGGAVVWFCWTGCPWGKGSDLGSWAGPKVGMVTLGQVANVGNEALLEWRKWKCSGKV